MASVFLSYDRDDARKARPLAAALEKAGHSVWWDQHIGGGAQYAKEIEAALNSADVVVVLWSPASVESAWVRDEAGAGRDRGRLVPLSVGGTQPPLGFRQFQAIDLGLWTGRGKVPLRAQILDAIERLPAESGVAPQSGTAPARPRGNQFARNTWAIVGLAAGMFFVAVGLLVGRPWEKGSSGVPTVSVVATDGTQLSNSIAEGVRANLGSVQGNSATNFRVADAQSKARSNFEVTLASTEHEQELETNVALVSASDKTVLWSKQLRLPATDRALLGQATAFAVAPSLGCATQEWSSKSARLSADARRRFLKACAAMDDASDPRALISDFRKIIQETPAFRPAWAHLLMAEVNFLTSNYGAGEALKRIEADLRQDIDEARKVDPDMPEATLAEIELQPPTSFFRALQLIDGVNASHPDNAMVLDARSQLLQRVGRMIDAADDAKRAAEAVPYSPVYRTNYVRALAYSGGIEKAWEEMAKAKRLWPDSSVVADADYALNLRFGDFEKAWRSSGRPVEGGIQGYFDILRDPSDANINAWIRLAETHQLSDGERAFVYGALPAMGRVDQDFRFMDEWPVERDFEGQTYVLFRPWFNNLRRDPRFIGLAKRLGLVAYWQKSGNWPDFCFEADLPYECKEEAAKLP